MRLIDVDNLMNNKVWLCGGFVVDDYAQGYMAGLDAVEEVIKATPIIDAVPIIRCKDCAYFHPYPFEPKYGSCKYHLGPDLQWEEKKETDYCSDAERLEDE